MNSDIKLVFLLFYGLNTYIYKTKQLVHKKHDTPSHTLEIFYLSLHQTYQYGRISHHIKCQLLAQSGF